MRSTAGVLLLGFLIGCNDHAAPSARSSSDTLPFIQPLPAPPPSLALPKTLAVPADARAECAAAAAGWQAFGKSTVARRDTLVTPVNRNAHDQQQPEEVLPPTPACMVTLHIDSLENENPRTMWEKRAGWTALWMISADGPDGGMLTYQKGIVRCQVRESVDGGDDSDTTYVPSPFYEQEVICWHHNRLLLPSDTMSPV